MSDVDESTLRDFVVFCLDRRAVSWPSLYDEMCYVAGHRLFRDMGYEDLREAGLDFTLGGSQAMARLARDVIERRRLLGAPAS
ncbi:MAG: hypothetical protein AUH85_17810 [Chloroflexi bacterium 13_1_40CM_4_68_4]|nr:MAG: hypothetical protein AUH85_17810 [Chloroflexi bacterium 13_1_40CM_4_68_4]